MLNRTGKPMWITVWTKRSKSQKHLFVDVDHSFEVHGSSKHNIDVIALEAFVIIAA